MGLIWQLIQWVSKEYLFYISPTSFLYTFIQLLQYSIFVTMSFQMSGVNHLIHFGVNPDFFFLERVLPFASIH